MTLRAANRTAVPGSGAACPSGQSDSVLWACGIEFDWEHRRASRFGRTLRLSIKEFYLLGLLISNPGKTLSREHILRVVWWRSSVGPRTVDAMIARLRRILTRGYLADPIRTVLGQGYMFSDDAEFSRRAARPRKKLQLGPSTRQVAARSGHARINHT
jgi:DNA-binding response OmpR family regulator